MNHPKAVGDRTTLAVMLALQATGFDVLVPFGENTRYDLVIDDGVRLARVQCKSGRLRGGGVRFKTASSYAHHRSPSSASRPYFGQIDYFGVYCIETAGVYLVPISDLPTRTMATLRVEPARNGQQLRTRLAADYLIAAVSLDGANRPT